jgi:pyruvate formate-lyase activating enzyme-like uncharacterized protein
LRQKINTTFIKDQSIHKFPFPIRKNKSSFLLENVLFEDLSVENRESFKKISTIISEKVVSFFSREKNVSIKEKDATRRNYGIHIRYHCSSYFKFKSDLRKNYKCKKLYSAHYLIKSGAINVSESDLECKCL